MEIKGDNMEIKGDNGQMLCKTIGFYLPKSEAISPFNSIYLPQKAKR